MNEFISNIGVNTTTPVHLIHIFLSDDTEFDDKDIQAWAKGELEALDNPVHLRELIHYLSLIIADRVLPILQRTV